MPEDYASLIERLEKAEGPDREIDQAITDAFAYFFPFQPDPYSWRVKVGDKYYDTERFGQGGSTSDRYVPKYTSDLNAALSLVERKLPGWRVEMVKTSKGQGRATICEADPLGLDYYAKAPTPALAVCLALLRALSAQASSIKAKV